MESDSLRRLSVDVRLLWLVAVRLARRDVRFGV